MSSNIVRIVSRTATRLALPKPKASPVWQQLQRARKASTTQQNPAGFAGGAEGGFGGAHRRQ
jgi:hypothetical protein